MSPDLIKYDIKSEKCFIFPPGICYNIYVSIKTRRRTHGYLCAISPGCPASAPFRSVSQRSCFICQKK